MNRFDSIEADSNPALSPRLQATLPNGTDRPRQTPPAAMPPRLHQTTFTPAARAQPPQPKSKPPEQRTDWFRASLQAIASHAWLIVVLALVGVLLTLLYSQFVCVPLFGIQASIEVRSSDPASHVEALAHVLQSQSLVNSVLAGMPDSEQSQLVERAKVHLLPAKDFRETLHQRIETVAVPSANIIDIFFTAPSRGPAVHFVDGLVQALSTRQRNEEASLPAGGDSTRRLPTHAIDQITIIDPASASTEPVSPNLPANILIAALAGILLAVVIALLRTFATSTFTGPGSVSQVLGVRELGSIPERKLLGPAGADAAHAGVQMDPSDESLRYLRSSLLYHPGKQPVRFLAFTSAAPGEGKTTVVANLSMSLAATGRRVLVVDGDLRRPRLHKLLRVATSPGLADLLRRTPSDPPASLSHFVSATSFQNLFVLPPGSAGIDTPEILAGPHLAQLFRELSKSFDFVLIDTPPLLACSDARNYARAVEGVVLVVRASETQKRAALVARDMLLQDGAVIIGTVLTGWRQNYPAYNYPAATPYAKT